MKTWLITGVSKGLGKQIALQMLEQGDRVIGTVRSEQDHKEFSSQAGGRAIALLLDVTDFDEVSEKVAEAEREHGPIDVLVNNAGYGLTGAIEETSIREIRSLFDVNVLGAIAMIQAVLPGMRRRRAGHIVNVSSASGLAPWAGTGIYGASKYALECIGQTLADEVSPLGIHVTNVAPGGMRTDFAGGSLRAVEPTIPDYETTAHMAHQVLSEGKGREPSAPGKIASAIAHLVEMDVPPRLLLLGADAYKYATDHLRSQLDAMDAFKELTHSVSAEAV